MRVTLPPRIIEVPDDATHYSGELGSEDVLFYKRRDIGVAGEHWFWAGPSGEWTFCRHAKPHWIYEIPREPEPVAWLTNTHFINSPRYTVTHEGDTSGCECFPVYRRPS